MIYDHTVFDGCKVGVYGLKALFELALHAVDCARDLYRVYRVWGIGCIVVCISLEQVYTVNVI